MPLSPTLVLTTFLMIAYLNQVNAFFSKVIAVKSQVYAARVGFRLS